MSACCLVSVERLRKELLEPAGIDAVSVRTRLPAVHQAGSEQDEKDEGKGEEQEEEEEDRTLERWMARIEESTGLLRQHKW